MFHFKQFSIDDSKAAMKIGTDAVLLGAWTPCSNRMRILDIGTGSGILALMMAQRNQGSEIDAVEIDVEAAKLANLNIQLSPWSGSMHIFNSSIQEFTKGKKYSYDLIVCNPPFFTDSLKGPDTERNLARHNDMLSVKDLLGCTSELLTENGHAAFIVPADAYGNWAKEAARCHLFPQKLTWVKSSPAHIRHRAMMLFSQTKVVETVEDEICIYNPAKSYSQEYRELTKDFYLKF